MELDLIASDGKELDGERSLWDGLHSGIYRLCNFSMNKLPPGQQFIESFRNGLATDPTDVFGYVTGLHGKGR